MMHDKNKNTKLSFRAERSVAKNLENIYVDVHEIFRTESSTTRLPPFGRLNDITNKKENETGRD